MEQRQLYWTCFAYADELVDYIKVHSVVRENDTEIGRR